MKNPNTVLFKSIKTGEDLFLKVTEIFAFLELGWKEMTNVTTGGGRRTYGRLLHYSWGSTVIQNSFMQMKEVMDTVILTQD